jgi:NADH:ubiquinone oxidoreductase subunit E
VFWSLKDTGSVWLLYNFEIKYRPRVNNADVDALSRLPALANITDNTSELPLASVQAICNFISVPAIETISYLVFYL